MHTEPAVPFPISLHRVAEATEALTTWLPVPGLGVLPASAFVLHGAEPVIVDAGVVAQAPAFLRAFAASIDLASVRWIWLTHVDADHVGCLAELLAAAPEAQLVTTFLGLGKLGLHGMQPERVRLLHPGEQLRLTDRTLRALRPLCFDAPETTGLFDTRTGSLFTVDCFGAVLAQPAARADQLPPVQLAAGIARWAGIDAPWLADIDAARFGAAAAALRQLDVGTVLGSHLPPAPGMLEALIDHLDAARRQPVRDDAGGERLVAAG